MDNLIHRCEMKNLIPLDHSSLLKCTKCSRVFCGTKVILNHSTDSCSNKNIQVQSLASSEGTQRNGKKKEGRAVTFQILPVNEEISQKKAMSAEELKPDLIPLQIANDVHASPKTHRTKKASRRQKTFGEFSTTFDRVDLNYRSNSHPDQLNSSSDRAKISYDPLTECQPNGRAVILPRSLPPSLEDISINNSLKKTSFGSSFMDSETRHSQNSCHTSNDQWYSRPTEFRLRDHLFSFIQASDNKIAMKLFGSRNALLKEKQRQIEAKTWIIHPCSNFRLYWDLLMLIFLATNLVVLPVSIAFFYDDIGVHWIVFNIICDTMFILDIFVNFRTGLIDQECHRHVILDSKEIATKYLKSWFVIDVVSSLPLDYVFLGIEGQSYSAGRALRILRLTKLLQLLRLLRISRLLRYAHIWQEFFSLASIVAKLFNLIAVMILMGHWNGCIQFFIPVIQGLPSDSWVIVYQIQNKHWFEQYTRSLFKALSHMLSVGYGSYPPRNLTDTWLTIISMLTGCSCYALFVGHTTTLIQSLDTSSRHFRDHIQQVNEYMIYRKLPTDLRRRITDYYDHRFGGKMFDEKVILSEISDTLRKDVIYHNCRELIKQVPFFVNADINFVMDVITQLEFEMFQPGDIIVKIATRGDRMFFIQEGLVEIISKEGQVVTRLGDGSYFGEICLLTHTKRVATVRAVTYSNVFSLSKEHFDKVLENYPLMRRTLETIAVKRLHTLGIEPDLVTSRESLLDDVHGIQQVFQAENEAHTDDESAQSNDEDSVSSPKEFLTAVKSFFTKDSDNYSQSTKLLTRTKSVTSTNMPNLSKSKNALNQLIVIPNITQSFTRRVKSSADVENLTVEPRTFLFDRLTNKPNFQKSGLKPSGSQATLFSRKIRSRSSSFDDESIKKGSSIRLSRATSPPTTSKGFTTLHPRSAPQGLIVPEVTITADNDSALDGDGNGTVAFYIDNY